jgi:acyl-CoA reductase-like NAD-dependent aldehyde dehydrogenase
MNDIGMLIEGRAAKAEGGDAFERRSPITDEVVTRAPAAKAADAVAAVEAASAAFKDWSELGPNARRAILLKAADLLQSRAPDFARLMTAETGSTTGWGMFNAILGAGHLREAACLTTSVAGEVIPSDKPGNLALAIRVPAGVCVGIAPWNAPVILGVRAIAMALACGNTVILKASEACPATHRLIGEVLNEAGVPPGVINVLTNAPADAAEVVEALVTHPKVRRVNFTGSTRVGRIIGELCGRHLKPALLELGGKAPLVVLDDADLDAAVAAAAFSAFMNQGQICMSAERIIVHEAIADAFVEKFRAKAATITAGQPEGGAHILGSLVSRAAMGHIETLLADALAKGGKVISGGKADGAFMDATIVDHVTPEMAIYTEESFGPSVSVIRVKDDEEAIRVANDTEYGLSAAVFSLNINRALSVAKRIESGICHINGPTVADEPQMPFGGVKASGYGRFGGKGAISEFTDLRWITIESKQHYPF